MVVYVQIRSDKMLLLAWLGIDADAIAQGLCKSLYSCLWLMPVCFPFCINCWRSAFLVYSHWLASLPCVCFFIVFGWNPWSTCTLKVKKFFFVALAVQTLPVLPSDHAVGRVGHMATALLYSISFWRLRNILHCRTSWGGLYCTEDAALITAKASPGFVLVGTADFKISLELG